MADGTVVCALPGPPPIVPYGGSYALAFPAIVPYTGPDMPPPTVAYTGPDLPPPSVAYTGPDIYKPISMSKPATVVPLNPRPPPPPPPPSTSQPVVQYTGPSLPQQQMQRPMPTPTTTSTTSGSTGPSGSSGSAGSANNAVAQTMLGLTNAKRATSAGTKPMTWNADLATLAQKRADANLNASIQSGFLTESHGDLTLPNGSRVGQNLAIETGSSPAVAAANAVNGWYNEKALWDASSGKAFLKSAGHYTQLMWKGSTQVGCALSTGTLNSLPLVAIACNYSPPGNVTGEANFVANVDAPRR